jgi:hypothetical protein
MHLQEGLEPKKTYAFLVGIDGGIALRPGADEVVVHDAHVARLGGFGGLLNLHRRQSPSAAGLLGPAVNHLLIEGLRINTGLEHQNWGKLIPS